MVQAMALAKKQRLSTVTRSAERFVAVANKRIATDTARQVAKYGVAAQVTSTAKKTNTHMSQKGAPQVLAADEHASHKAPSKTVSLDDSKRDSSRSISMMAGAYETLGSDPVSGSSKSAVVESNALWPKPVEAPTVVRHQIIEPTEAKHEKSEDIRSKVQHLEHSIANDLAAKVRAMAEASDDVRARLLNEAKSVKPGVFVPEVNVE